MKAWDIEIDSDESGFTMRVRTDCEDGSCDFLIFLPSDVAEQLYRGVKREIVPWLIEKEDAYATRPPSTRQLQDELDSGVYDHDIGKRIGIEREIERRGCR